MKAATLIALMGCVQSKQREMPLPVQSGEPDRIEKTHAKLVRGPISPVDAASSSPVCLFQDDDNNWCISTTAPMLKAGWNWQ